MKLSKMACLAALLLMPLMGIAQDIDLWDTWRLGFEKYEAAEKEYKNKNMKEALKLYKESQAVFQKIRNASPDWNKDVVAYRISLCDRKIKAINVPAAPSAAERQYKNEVVKLRKEVLELKTQLRQTRVQLIDAKNAADRMALTEKQVRKLMTENSDLQKKIAAKDASITSLKADLRRSDKTAEFQKLLLDAKTDLEKLRLVNDRLKKDLETAKKRAQKFMDQRNATETKMYRLENQLKELAAKKKEVEVISGENRKIAAAMNQIAEKLKAAEQAVATVKKQNAYLQSKIDDMESGKIVSTSEKKLRDDLAAERNTVNSLNSALEKFKKDSQKLTAELNKLRGENQKVVLELVKVTESLAKLRNENGDLSKIIEKQKDELDAAKKVAAENVELKKNIANISKNFEDFRQQAKKDSEAAVKNLTIALEHAKVEYNNTAERLRSADENLKNSVAKLQQTIVKLEEEKAVLKQALILANQDVNSHKGAIEKLKIEYAALKKEFDALNVPAPVAKPDQKSAEAVKKLEKLTKEVAQLKNENAKYQTQIAATTEQKTAVAAVNKELESKLEKLTRELAQLKIENTKYQAQLAAKSGQKTIAPAAAVNKELEGKLEKLTHELAQLKAENAKYQAQLAAKTTTSTANKELERKLEKLTGEVAQLKVENAKYQTQLSAKTTTASAANKELESKSEKLAHELAQLKKENAKYQAELAAKSSAHVSVVKELESKLEKLAQELAQLKKDNANYRVQLASFDRLQKEINELRDKLTQANKELVKKESEKVANMEQIRVLSLKVTEQGAAIKTAEETIARKDVVINNNAKDMKNAVELLKKQLDAAQKSETALRKDLELLKMEYSDLEKKTIDTVPKSSLTALREQISRLDKELTALRSAKAESDAALKSAEELVALQKKRLVDFSKQINPDANNQINKLTAAVVELQEAKIHYESILSKLRTQVKELTEDNKELRLANTSLRADSAELKVKPAELEKTISDLKNINENLRKLTQEQTEQVRKLKEKTNADEKTLTALQQDLATANALAQRYRKELNEWGELPQTNLTEEVAKKNKAIDTLVTENDSLRNERDMLKTELTLAKDIVVKYKKLVFDLDSNLQMNKMILERVKNALVRYTSVSDVEKLVTNVYDSKKGEFASVAPVEEVQKKVATIKKDDAPKYTQKEIAEREAIYKSSMKQGATAEAEKNYDDALVYYWRASGYCTDASEVHKALARIYLAKRDFNNARYHYKTAVQKFNLKRDPDFEEKLVRLAQEVSGQSNSKDAK